ncbi:hypothetical protein [Paraburkholderia sp. A3RO-2L]|uniref:hypothetical protein n=1 Tax=Paraburkholderia sp. A3RO-2L TaxID=3028376 RepID=UPI003DAA0B33
MAVTRRGDAADPEQGADGTHSPAVRTAESGGQVSGHDEYDADCDPQRALGKEAATLQA